MKYIVLGGGGFIGSHLTDSIIHLGNEVFVFDQADSPNLAYLSKMGAKILTGSFLSSQELTNAMAGVDIVYHLIGTTVPRSSNTDPAFDIESNLVGTINILNAARDTGVKKIVIASSGGTVYGIPQTIPIPETHSTNPISSYGITKLAIEKYAHLYFTLYGLDYCILRMSNAYGERQVVNGIQGVIPTIINEILNHQEIHIWGDGSVVRDFIYVSDIVDAFIKAGDHTGESRIFNIGSGIGHSINDIVGMLGEFFKSPLSIIYDSKCIYDVPLNILDITLAKRTMHWTPKVKILDGLQKTVSYMKKQNIAGRI